MSTQASIQKRAPTLNPILADFWRGPSRGRVLYGGRASTKSWDAVGMSIRIGRDVKVKIMCVRQFQANISQSVYTLLKNRIYEFGFESEFDIQRNRIFHLKTHSEWIFYGIYHHTEDIKSTEGVDILYIEEAEGLTQEQFEILKPTIRKEGSEIWIVFNPRYVFDYSYVNFVIDPPEGWRVRKINYDENPFLSDTALGDIRELYRKDPDLYRHIYLGEPKGSSDTAVIQRHWIMAAVEIGREPEKYGIYRKGPVRLGFDVADAGGDRCCMALSQASITFHLESWRANQDEMMRSTIRMHGTALRHKAEVIYDSIGVGAGVGSSINLLNDEMPDKKHKAIQHKPFRAGSTKFLNGEYEYQDDILHKDFFKNIKAQAWWLIADRFRYALVIVEEMHKYEMGEGAPPEIDPDKLIAIDPELDQLEALITELTIPERREDLQGRVMVESKEDLAKRNVPSTDLADAFVMANWVAPVEVDIFTEFWGNK